MKKLDTDFLRRSVILHIVFAIFILLLISVVVTYFIQEHRQNQMQESHISQIDRTIKYSINKYIKSYTPYLQEVADTTDLAQLLAQKNHEAIKKLTNQIRNNTLKSDTNLAIMNIFSADEPQKGIKPLIDEVHKKHIPLHGFESAPEINLFTIAVPIFDKQKKYLGAFEMGFYPWFLLEDIKEINDACGMIFEDSTALRKKLRDSVEIDGYLLVSTLSEELKSILPYVKHLSENIKIDVGDKEYITHTYELKNIKGEVKVKMLFFQDTSQTATFQKYLLLTLVYSVGAIFAFLIWFIYKLLNVHNLNVQEIYKEQLKKINESENRFRTLYKKSPNSYQSLDANGYILMVNDRWLEELGYERDEVIGKDFRDFIAAKDRSDFEANFAGYTQRKKIKNLELKIIKKNKRQIDVVFYQKAIFNENKEFKNILCSFIDVTKEKELEKEIEFNRHYLQTIFEITPNIMLTTNGKYIDKVNDAMLDFTHYNSIKDFKKEHECICDLFIKGKGFLSPKIDNMTWIEYIQKNTHQLHKARMFNGNKLHIFLVWAKPLVLDKNTRSLVIFTDITELEETYSQLDAKDEIMLAQSRHAAMGEMISMIAHQWRQPISVIAMGANNILADIELGTLNELELKENAKDIVNQTQELSKTIDDFRNFFKTKKDTEIITVKDVFNDVYAIVGKSLENNNIETIIHCNNDKKIQTYSRELMQVFINIVKNAKEAIVENNIKEGKLTISVEQLKDSMSIKICDNGGGIKDCNMTHIFEPYFTTKSEKNGTGIGLYMSKTIIEKHLLGSLSVENEKDGACFKITLPFSITEVTQGED